MYTKSPVAVTRQCHRPRLELCERLCRGLVLGHAEDVEPDGFGEGSALAWSESVLPPFRYGNKRGLTDGDGVALFHTESGGAVGGEVLVAFLVSAVFGDTAAELLRRGGGRG